MKREKIATINMAACTDSGGRAEQNSSNPSRFFNRHTSPHELGTPTRAITEDQVTTS